MIGEFDDLEFNKSSKNIAEEVIGRILYYNKNLFESYIQIITDYYDKMIDIFANKIQENQKSLLETYMNFLNCENKAVFRARIQKGGRIAIPEIEREALGLEEGDIVKIILIKNK